MVCADFLKVAAGNIKVYSYSERRYYCTTCRQTFSADAGTFFETLRSERHQVVDVLAMLMERNSLRALERLRHHSHNAILHWVDLAGQHTAAVSAYLIKDLHLTQAQIDELWTFVKKSKPICY
jgi:transposase-like protein